MDASGEREDRRLREPLLDDRTIDAIARRVTQLLRQEHIAPRRQSLVSAAEIARRFGVSRQWVYENAERLGAVRLGRGARPRLRFDPRHVESQLCSTHEPPESGSGKGAADQRGIDPADLIPIRRL